MYFVVFGIFIWSFFYYIDSGAVNKIFTLGFSFLEPIFSKILMNGVYIANIESCLIFIQKLKIFKISRQQFSNIFKFLKILKSSK